MRTVITTCEARGHALSILNQFECQRCWWARMFLPQLVDSCQCTGGSIGDQTPGCIDGCQAVAYGVRICRTLIRVVILTCLPVRPERLPTVGPHQTRHCEPERLLGTTRQEPPVCTRDEPVHMLLSCSGRGLEAVLIPREVA